MNYDPTKHKSRVLTPLMQMQILAGKWRYTITSQERWACTDQFVVCDAAQ